MIKTVNLRKEFGQNIAVKNLNLDIPKGSFFSLVGPNAAGKTTTIKMLVGLLKPTSGEIYIGGKNISENYLSAKKLISYIPDTPYLYDKLTASEFLRFIGDIYEIDRKKQRIAAGELLEKFGLNDKNEILIENFSHGMKQRLIFCAAFLHEPQVIVVDEPMVGLDPIAIKLVKDSLKEKARQGATIFMSTHTLAICEEISSKIGIINEGELIALGTVDEIRKMTGVAGEKLEDLFLKLMESGAAKE